MSGAHAFLPPSGAGAWVHCAAWPTMNAMFPQDDEPPSMEGTAAHWVFEQDFLDIEVMVGQFAPNGVPVSEEMLDGADLYVRTIEADLALAGLTNDYLQIEERVKIPAIHAQNDGTPDTWFYDARARILYLYDYKFGHDFVDAFENWQLIDYTSGIVDWLANGHAVPPAVFDQSIRVVMTVVQPRNYDPVGTVRRWGCQASDLRAHWNKLASAAEAAFHVPPLATPGAHCKHCPGRHACQPLQRQAYQAVTFARQTYPAPLEPAALSSELRILQDNAELLSARISGLEAEAEARLRRGEQLAGYGLKPGQSRVKWRVPVEQAIAAAAACGFDIAKRDALTPTQARDRGVPDALIDGLVDRTPGTLKLARVSLKDAARAFSK